MSMRMRARVQATAAGCLFAAGAVLAKGHRPWHLPGRLCVRRSAGCALRAGQAVSGTRRRYNFPAQGRTPKSLSGQEVQKRQGVTAFRCNPF